MNKNYFKAFAFHYILSVMQRLFKVNYMMYIDNMKILHRFIKSG